MVGQEVPVVKERIAKEPVGQVVLVVQERAAKERVDGDKDECVEVKRKKAKRTPLAFSSSLCVSSTANGAGNLERCEDLGASANVKVTNIKTMQGIVPPSVVLYPVSCISTPVVQGWGSNQQELPPVALRRSTRFREPSRIPSEGDFIGPRQSLNKGEWGKEQGDSVSGQGERVSGQGEMGRQAMGFLVMKMVVDNGLQYQSPKTSIDDPHCILRRCGGSANL
ncbi:hypothetical protein RHSIM_Rhsim12G0199000 [Rhododendron simsii]|uniref:Uncharacterized protein n=1 Tax=Rhododendron simsii TaxID=118357 RepID=A0A834G6N8_RHOSS|nr:hypothetical protein RHSIM_Rhsim12G0199000 [Rhododendron simsii]